jgi:hypothetical protein
MSNQPQPTPNDRMISLGDALEEFYRDQMAKASREGQRLGLDSPTTPLPKTEERP